MAKYSILTLNKSPCMKYLWDVPSLAEDVYGKRPKNALDKEPAGKVLSICMDRI